MALRMNDRALNRIEKGEERPFVCATQEAHEALGLVVKGLHLRRVGRIRACCRQLRERHEARKRAGKRNGEG